MWIVDNICVDPKNDRKIGALAVSKQSNKKIPLFVYLPTDSRTCRKVLFVMHGRTGNANKARDVFSESLPIERNIMVVAPKIDMNESSLMVTIGGMKTRTSKELLPVDEWTFKAIDDIFGLMKQFAPNIDEYMVYGHSAGAQFAHRMTVFTNFPNMTKSIAANAGWYTFLDANVEFPYGIKGMLDDNDLREVLSKKLIVLSGADDVMAGGRVRSTSLALEQGRNRFERAANFYNFSEQLSNELQTGFQWEMEVVKNLGHDSAAAAKSAVKYIT
jgi:hypothetical protein